jgi:TFIIF-interacting CTD phosphatase-like protein
LISARCREVFLTSCRQSCTQHNGTYIKDLAIIEPDLSKVLLIDNSPISYAINQGEMNSFGRKTAEI